MQRLLHVRQGTCEETDFEKSARVLCLGEERPMWLLFLGVKGGGTLVEFQMDCRGYWQNFG